MSDSNLLAFNWPKQMPNLLFGGITNGPPSGELSAKLCLRLILPPSGSQTVTMCWPTSAGQLTISSLTGSQPKLEGLRENHWHWAVIATLFNSFPQIGETFPLIYAWRVVMATVEALKICFIGNYRAIIDRL